MEKPFPLHFYILQTIKNEANLNYVVLLDLPITLLACKADRLSSKCLAVPIVSLCLHLNSSCNLPLSDPGALFGRVQSLCLIKITHKPSSLCCYIGCAMFSCANVTRQVTQCKGMSSIWLHRPYSLWLIRQAWNCIPAKVDLVHCGHTHIIKFHLPALKCLYLLYKWTW